MFFVFPILYFCCCPLTSVRLHRIPLRLCRSLRSSRCRRLSSLDCGYSGSVREEVTMVILTRYFGHLSICPPRMCVTCAESDDSATWRWLECNYSASHCFNGKFLALTEHILVSFYRGRRLCFRCSTSVSVLYDDAVCSTNQESSSCFFSLVSSQVDRWSRGTHR